MIISNRQIFTLMAISAALSALSHFGAGHEFWPFFLGAFLTATALTILSNIHTLRQYEKGEQDCKAGLPHKACQGPEYDEGYGFEYMREQTETARSIESDLQHQQQA